MGEQEPNALPRWVQIPFGLFLLPITLLCLGGSGMVVINPPDKNPLFAIIVGSVMIIVSFWGIEKSIRLIFTWKTQDGLIGPIALRIIGVFFLLIPIAGFFTGYYIQHGFVAIVQAVANVLAAFGVFALARTRSKNRAPIIKVESKYNDPAD